MTILPVLERELRAESRHALTYFLRYCGAFFPCLIFWLLSFDTDEPLNDGKILFQIYHALVFVMIWASAPLVTFDVLSREKRDGTLGLLFLTPLKAPDIVLAKALTQGIRLVGLGMAAIPTMCVPFLAGGVGWMDAVVSLLVNGSALLWAVAAGLLASACCKSMLRALLCAYGFATLNLLSFNFVVSALLQAQAPNIAFYSRLRFENEPILLGARASWSWVMDQAPAGGARPLFSAFCAVAVISCGWFWLQLILAGKIVQGMWQDKHPNQKRLRIRKCFCTPKFAPSFFKRWLRWNLEQNPVGWLEQRSLSGRVFMWGWLGLVVAFYGVGLAFDDIYQEFDEGHAWMVSILLGSLALSAAISFKRELETGLFELMLVSPLKTEKIIGGRIRGLWSQFTPAFVLLMIFWCSLRWWLKRLEGDSDNEYFISTLILCPGTFLSLPAVSLYFSLRSKQIIPVLIATFTVTCVVPVVLAASAFPHFPDPLGVVVSTLLFFGAQIGTAIWCYRALAHNLRTRRFALEKTGAGP
jgi:ABC-type transport system involved in multi-copper enzyme maturation permease subunit